MIRVFFIFVLALTQISLAAPPPGPDALTPEEVTQLKELLDLKIDNDPYAARGVSIGESGRGTEPCIRLWATHTLPQASHAGLERFLGVNPSSLSLAFISSQDVGGHQYFKLGDDLLRVRGLWTDQVPVAALPVVRNFEKLADWVERTDVKRTLSVFRPDRSVDALPVLISTLEIPLRLLVAHEGPTYFVGINEFSYVISAIRHYLRGENAFGPNPTLPPDAGATLEIVARRVGDWAARRELLAERDSANAPTVDGKPTDAIAYERTETVKKYIGEIEERVSAIVPAHRPHTNAIKYFEFAHTARREASHTSFAWAQPTELPPTLLETSGIRLGELTQLMAGAVRGVNDGLVDPGIVREARLTTGIEEARANEFGAELRLRFEQNPASLATELRTFLANPEVRNTRAQWISLAIQEHLRTHGFTLADVANNLDAQKKASWAAQAAVMETEVAIGRRLPFSKAHGAALEFLNLLLSRFGRGR